MLFPLALTLLWSCQADVRHLNRPNMLVVGNDGTVMVSDFLHDRIVEFSPEGTFVRTYGGQGLGRNELWRVTSMTLDHDGSLVVANRRPSEIAEDAWTTDFKRFIDGREVDNRKLEGVVGKESFVNGLAPAPTEGSLVIADASEGDLLVIDAAGRHSGGFGGIPREDAAPNSITLDSDGWYWIVEQYRHRVRKLKPGGLEERVLFMDEGHGPPSFPTAVAVCAGQWFAVADLGNHRVQRYDMKGRWISEFEPPNSAPEAPVQLMDVDTNADCSKLYLTDSKGSRVLVTTPAGELLHELKTW